MNSLRLRAVLQVAHPADGFGLLAGVAVSSVDHLGVSFLPTAVLGVLKPCEREAEGFKSCNYLHYALRIKQ